ncbi:MAG: isoaspartyl peptidase/L-asparaginase family protein [Gammaproteobacteria bacterium]
MQTASIIVHGGAGPLRDEYVEDARAGCRAAAVAGWKALEKGGAALDAVVAAVTCLEDNPAFNAGTGAALNADGDVQLDASIMNADGLQAGAVAAVERVRNPIQLARMVLEDGRHVLLVAAGAERFAREHGVAACDPSELITGRRRRRWEAEHGTVGCVARDSRGRFAAGTSTGGISGMLPGRVGDSPQIGSGTYANATGGVSCTGIGEAIIRAVLAKSAVDRMGAGRDAPQAAAEAMALFARQTASEAGLIAIDAQGRVGFARNTSHMPVAWVIGNGEVQVEV